MKPLLIFGIIAIILFGIVGYLIISKMQKNQALLVESLKNKDATKPKKTILDWITTLTPLVIAGLGVAGATRRI